MDKSKTKGINIYDIIDQEVENAHQESEPNISNQKIMMIINHLEHLRSRYTVQKVTSKESSQNLFDLYQQMKLSKKLNQIIRDHIENDLDYRFFYILYIAALDRGLFDLEMLWEKQKFSPLQDYVDHCNEWSLQDKDKLAKHINFMYDMSSSGVLIKDVSKIKIYCDVVLEYLSNRD
jgi:hypothetical protein